MNIKFLAFSLLSLSSLSLCSQSDGITTMFNYTNHGQAITLFAHGIGGTLEQASHYKHVYPTANYGTFNFPDAPEKLFKRHNQTGLAQTTELSYLAQAIEMALSYNEDLILFGVSRGASSIINVVGNYALIGPHANRIKALVLESPFAHAEDVVFASSQSTGMPMFFTRFVAKRLFKEYDRTTNIPYDFVRRLPQDIPVLIVCSQEDTTVPASSSIKLYHKLKQEMGRSNVHLLNLQKGKHSNILWGPDGHEYQQALHAFYQFYELPHDEALARQGKSRFLQCQPTIKRTGQGSRLNPIRYEVAE